MSPARADSDAPRERPAAGGDGGSTPKGPPTPKGGPTPKGSPTAKSALSREFMDDAMIRWEAYVSGGHPGTPAAARIYFVCLDDPFERPRYVEHESGRVAEATRDLAGASEADLVELLSGATPLE